ncbi:MAG: hypothetical protein WCT54_00935 [Patescibacteria group bacterium]|jgi:hypothetical protein
MSTKTIRQPLDSSSTQPVCKLCEQPILHGPEYKYESEANMHRRCLKKDVHQLAIASTAHGLWLKAYTALCRELPKPLDELMELFREYWVPGEATIIDYIKCLDQASKLVESSSFTTNNKSRLVETVDGLRDRIRHLASTGAN